MENLKTLKIEVPAPCNYDAPMAGRGVDYIEIPVFNNRVKGKNKKEREEDEK